MLSNDWRDGDLAEAVVIACEMIEDEVRLALEALPPEDRPPVVWVESGLHDHPELLQAALQKLVDLLDEGASTGSAVLLPTVRPGMGPAPERSTEVLVGPVDEVLLAFGFCGKGLQGLKAQHLTLIFPRVDDCVSLLLNHGCTREEIPRDSRSYYMTRGWFAHSSSVTEAFQDWTERYGAERAARLRKTLFTGYERMGLIDTSAYDIGECIDQSRAYAEELELEHVIVQGSVQLLEQLFRGEQSSEIVVVPPKEAIGFTHLFAQDES